MSSGGQILGGVVGAVVGFFTPIGVVYGAQMGLMIGGYLDPADGPKLQGPRIDDLSVQQSTYGASIPRVYGTIATFGNVFWVENNKLKETSSTTSSGGKGGGGGTETTSYSYSATFAVGLCEGPITAIKRIWVGSNLVYDASSSTVEGVIASNLAAKNFNIYYGTDTQLPDSRMQATLGVANTPAYRGLAYIVFKDFALADYGNSLVGAQVKVEVVDISSTSKEVLVDLYKPFTSPHANVAFNPQAAYIDSEVSIFYVCQWDNNYPTTSSALRYEISYDGSVKVTSTVSPGTNVPPNILQSKKDIFYYSSNLIFTGGGFDGPNGLIVEVGDLFVGLSTFNASMTFTKTIFLKDTLVGVQRNISANTDDIGITTDGTYVYVIGLTSTRKYDKNLNLLQTGGPAPAGQIAECRCFVSDTGQLYYSPVNVGNLYIVDNNLNYSLYASGLSFFSGYYGTSFIVSGSLLIIAGGGYQSSKLLSLKYYNLARVTSYSIPLYTVISSECLQATILNSADLSVSELTQSVKGYRITAISAIRSSLDQLQGAWPFDVIQSGYTLKFKARGSSSVFTIPASKLDARTDKANAGVSITNEVEMVSVLPVKLEIDYIDSDREYAVGTQYAERIGYDFVNTSSMELSIVMSSSEASVSAERLLYLYWLERSDVSFELPYEYIALEPGDVITINAEEATYNLRITEISYSESGILSCKAKFNSQALYVPAAVGEASLSTGSTLTLAGSTFCELADLPTLSDSLDMSGFFAIVSGSTNGWPGASLIRTDDAGQTWSTLGGYVNPGSVFGTATNTISSAKVDLFDKSSILNVSIHYGELTSVSELDTLNGVNYFAYGKNDRWEIIAAQTCTLQVDGSYNLTNLLRGRLGTEYAMVLHAASDTVILLDADNLSFILANINTIDLVRTYKAVTNGSTIANTSDIVFQYKGANLECLSPVWLNGNIHPTTNDWTLTWIRRSRINADWRDLIDVSLGEATELYDVVIYADDTYATIKRTFSSLTSATVSYTSVDQVTDFGSNQATLYLKVYQISAVVGRGLPLTTSITR